MEKKQLATEWLMEQLYNNEKLFMSGNGNVLDDLLDQAKEKEKDNIIKARHDGINYTLGAMAKTKGYQSDENYIKETFKPE